MKLHILSSILVLGFLWAGSISSPVRADQGLQAIKDAIGEVDEEITALKDLQNDKGLLYRRHLHRLIVTLMQNQIDDAQKTGNQDRVNALKAEIVSLTQDRDATWDESTALLDAECKKEELSADQKILTFKTEAERLEDTNAKKARIYEQAADAWTKYKPLIQQRYDLTKQVSAAREKEDFKTAKILYEKLKDIRLQMRAIDKESSKQIQQLEDKNSSDDPLNL